MFIVFCGLINDALSFE